MGGATMNVQVTVDPQSGRVDVLGPEDFVRTIDWNRVESSAKLFVPFASVEDSIRSAIQTQFAAWKGAQTLIVRERNEVPTFENEV
jgi:hypothetical protein